MFTIEPALEIINRTGLRLVVPNLRYEKQRYKKTSAAFRGLLDYAASEAVFRYTLLELRDRYEWYELLRAAF